MAALSVGAPIALVTLRVDRTLRVVGSHGIHLSRLDASWDMKRELIRRQSMSFVANVTRDTNFRNHPLLTFAPYTRSLVHVPVLGEHADIEAAISVINPQTKWPFSAQTHSTMTELAMLVGDSLKIASGAPADAPPHELKTGMEEAGTSLNYSSDTAGQFLLSTLRHRASIRNRKDVSYVTLRTWSEPIKKFQISALKIVKANTDPVFVDSVAAEMAEHVQRLFGVPRIGCVVPVPCGHSAPGNCLSIKIAKSLAVKLGVPYVEALANDERKGSSHPRKNSQLMMPELKVDAMQGSVLLVDDVATSGRHIELAIQRLRSKAEHVTAIAWVGTA